MEVNISEMLYTMSSLLFLILGTFLIFTVIAAIANPDENTAKANMENLVAKMKQVCITGQEEVLDFNLPQHTPALTGLLPVTPIWITRTNGDPNFVLYYEAYQPGDAIGWEVHHYMQSRLVAPLPENFNGRTEDDVINYVTRMKEAWATGTNERLEGIVINNIILGEKRTHYYFGGGVPAASSETESTGTGAPSTGPDVKTTLKQLGKLGAWEKTYYDDPLTPETPGVFEGNNRFAFQNYRALNSFEKTAIKYEPCGDRSLCLKTRSGVQRFKLEECGNIKYIELKYDARDRKAIYAAAGIVLIPLAVAGGSALLGAGGATAATVAASGEVVGGTAAVTQAVTIFGPGGAAVSTVTAPVTEVFLGTTLAQTTGGLVVPVDLIASGGTVTAMTTPAALAASGSTLGSVLGTIGRGTWWVAKGFARALWWGIGKIPGMQSAIKIGGTSVGVYKLGEFVTTAFLSYKVQDFHLASPCKTQLKIQKVPCSQMECATVASYPLYEYKNEKLSTVKDAGGNDIYHRTCLEKAGAWPTTANPPVNEGFGGGDCLRVTVEEKPGGFCWTPDPYRSSGSVWDADTRWVAERLNFMPIRANTGYLSAFEAVVLKYYPVRELESWSEWFERRISWAWPGPLLSN